MRIQRKKIRFSRFSFSQMYMIIAMILLFYTSGSMYNIIYYKFNGTIKIITDIFLMISIVKIKRKDYGKIFVLITVGLVLAFLNIINNGNMSEYFGIFLRLIGVYIFCLYCLKNNVDTLKLLYKFSLLCAIIYFICFLLFDIGPLQDNGNLVVVNEQVFTNYYNIYYRWHDLRKVFGLTFNSCNGPFSEPGLYMIWLNYGLIYELFFKERPNYVIAFFFIVTVITTTSTMGAILVCVIIGTYLYFFGGKYMRIMTLIPCVYAVYFVVLFIWNERINSRIESVVGRIGDIYVMINGIIRHPIIGNGIGSFKTTNSFFSLWYDFGIIGMMVMGIFMVCIGKSKAELKVKLVVLIWLILSLFDEPIIYTNLFFFTAFILYSHFTKCKKTIKYGRGL